MTAQLPAILADYRAGGGDLITILQAVQREVGYLSEADLLEIARFAKVPDSRVYGVATFYTQFRFTPIGRNRVAVCRGTACHVKGARRILEEIEKQLGIKEGETTPDQEYSLETVACIGACSLSPCIMINKTVAARMTPKKVGQLCGDGARK